MLHGSFHIIHRTYMHACIHTVKLLYIIVYVMFHKYMHACIPYLREYACIHISFFMLMEFNLIYFC